MSTEVHRRRRRAPRGRGAAPHWLGQLPYLIVLSGVAGGLVLCALAYFRKGSGLMAAALLFGALARLLLPESQLGHLAVRSRPVDCWTLVILGEMVAFVALSVPPMNKTGLLLAGVFGVLIALALGVRAVRFLLAERRAGRSGPSEEPGSSAGTGQV
ncbi:MULTISPECIES: DUF3017 domain-containing protein [Thermomonosporaceae]|uniref:DUF3017 domain-containing protein n=1 Tax=Thermomonosporaceae TaxID=2012 RepID=UPI00255A8FA1|nr:MULTISPECIES: DUF3017 domain-containing protein [Thermomonosporaceae]MDL4776165.1 DUF3017 domain-containing protein [Actinomadura xylanilytica]